jgi:hypothetical protein
LRASLLGAITEGDEDRTEELDEQAGEDEGEALSEPREQEERRDDEQPAGDH